MAQARYEISVAGVVPEEDLADMGATPIGVNRVNTMLYGVPDQAALFGLLSRLSAMGIDVVEVRRVLNEGPARDAAADDEPQR